MGITQSTYTERIGKAYNGQIANTHTCDADTFIVDDAGGIGWGSRCSATPPGMATAPSA